MIKLVCFDLNKTLINENSWLDLNLTMGVTEQEDTLLFNLYDEKIISYEEWQLILNNIYKSRGKANYENIYNSLSNYTYKDGAKKIVLYLKLKKYKVALLSGSIDLLVEKVAKELDIKYYGANNYFIFDSNGDLQNIAVLGDDKLVKLHQLQSFCRNLGISPDECVCIGDGDNDGEIFKYTQHGITFKGSKIEELAWKVINNLSDLEGIL